MSDSETWGSLESAGGLISKIAGSLFTIGRNKNCSIVTQDQRVSSNHCKIMLSGGESGDSATKTIYVLDTSTNGTWLNGEKLTKNEKVEIKSGDKIELVKNEKSLTFSFTTEQPQPEVEEEEEDNGGTLDYTQPMDDAEPEQDEEDQAGGKDEAGKAADGEQKKDDTAEADGKDKKKGSADQDAEIQAELKCSICLNVMYKAITLVPCMHNFCSSCYSKWMDTDRGKNCPECRNDTSEVRRNHALCGIIDKYLEEHPEFARSAEEKAQMDAENKVTDEFLRVSRKRNRDYSDDEDYSGSDYDSEEEPGCPNCEISAPDGFRCAAGDRNAHSSCSSCWQLVPARSMAADRAADSQVPSGKCEGCDQFWCAPYMKWLGNQAQLDTTRCNKYNSVVLTEASFDSVALPHSVFGWNRHEREITLSAIQTKGFTITSLFQHCLVKVRDGTLTIPEKPPFEQSDHRFTCRDLASKDCLCAKCVDRLFAAFACGWREALEKSALPDAAANRPDCHWGSNCRTQRHNQGHASRFNHCCPQTRFT